MTPAAHRFQYRLFLAYVDLGELPALTASRVLSPGKFGAASLRRGDHMGPGDGPLDDAIRSLVRDRLGAAPAGPIRMLTQLGCYGYYFNPLTLYYCFAADGRTVEALVAEVRNTPWRELHTYVLSQPTDGAREHRHAKAFHVSPFMGMDLDYRWLATPPAETLRVEIENLARDHARDRPFFRAELALARRPLTRASMNGALLRYPLQPLRIVAAIYYQAFKLWRKKCPYYPHPKDTQHTARPRDVHPSGPAGGKGAAAWASKSV